MGVRRQWKILKLSKLEMDSSTRANLIESITRKKNTQVTLYAWDINPTDHVAKEVFFTESAAIKDWFVKKHVWESQPPLSGVVIYKWAIHADKIMTHIQEAKVCNVPYPPTTEMSVGIVPSSLYEEVQRSLKIKK